MKRHGVCLPMKSSSYNRKLLFMVYIIGLSISLVKPYPSWDSPTTITDFGRNIRQLPCVSRRSGETGVCMFAYSCAKVNGTHLGTCIDRFYFGSCCKTQSNVDVEVNEPDNYLNNNVDNEVVAGPPVTTNVKLQQTTTDRYSTHASSQTSGFPSFPSTASLSYKPTTQFSVSTASSTTTTSTTSRNQYTEPSIIANSTKPPTANSSPTSSAATPSTLTSTTVYHQSTKPVQASTTFSTVKPMVKPSSYKPPIVTATNAPKPKPQQTAKPTVQFNVPSSTTSNVPYSSSQSNTNKPTSMSPTSTYTTVTSPRPVNSTATFSTIKPVVKPSSTTYKSTSTSTVPVSTTTPVSLQKIKPQTNKPVTVKPKPPSSVRPDPPSTAESTTDSYVTRSTVEKVTEIVSKLTEATTPMNNQNHMTSNNIIPAVTSMSPTLVTWTTLDTVPVIPSSENTNSPTVTYKPPPGVDISTNPTWVKLPVETHEPNTPSSAAPMKESTTSEVYSSILMSKPTSPQTPSENDIIITSNSINSVSSTTQKPSSTTVASTITTTTPTSSSTSSTSSTSSISSTSSTTTSTTITESFEAGNTPLNMSNYKDVCGRRLFPTARIVGGEKVSFGKWPWQISLRQWRTSTYLHKCGAALFNENWAVTAAHCVENVPPSDLLLRLGEHDLSVEEEPYGYEERRIQIVASHPQFDPRTFEYDLALLRFYEPVKFQPNIIPVCVPDDDSNFVGSSAYVTGWGRLYEDGPLPSVLQEVTVPVINNSVCETMYRAAGYIEHIPNIFICAGWKKGGFDSCEGDSGGPMVIQRPDKRWILAGIISWGIGCAEPNQPGVYTRISKFKDWINQILQF